MIRVSEKIKTRLSLVKGSSYESKIELMLDYFDATGSDPSKRIANPIFEVEKQVERVVKIIRNIENKKIDNILKLLEKANIKTPEIYTSKASVFSDEELEQINQMGDELKRSKEQIEILEKQLKKSVEKTKDDIEEGKIISHFQVIKNSVNDLFETKRTTEIEPSSFLINKNILTNTVRKITSITNNYVR